jgi:hypothetical protein
MPLVARPEQEERLAQDVEPPAKTAWRLDVTGEKMTPLALLPGALDRPRLALRQALPAGIMIRGSPLFVSEADRQEFMTDMGMTAATAQISAVMEETLAPGEFSEYEKNHIYEDIRAWCAAEEADRLKWTAHYVTISRIQPSAGRFDKPHPVPINELTAVARRTIDRAQFLGAYAGSLTKTADTVNYVYKLSMSSIPPQLYVRVSEAGEREPDLARKSELTDTLNSKWSVNGLQFRNQLALINDFNGYYEKRGTQYVDANFTVMFMEFWFAGNPFVGVVTSRDILEHSELTISYGGSYWYNEFIIKGRELLMKQIKTEREKAEGARHDTTSMTFRSLGDIGMGLYNQLFQRIAVLTGKGYERIAAEAGGSAQRLLKHLASQGKISDHFVMKASLVGQIGVGNRVTLLAGSLVSEWMAKLRDGLESCDLLLVFGNDLGSDRIRKAVARSRGGRVRLYVNLETPPPPDAAFDDARLDVVVTDKSCNAAAHRLADVMDIDL